MNNDLQLMKITGYRDEEYQDKIPLKSYRLMINPDTIKWDRSIEYAEEQAPDTSTPSQRYKSTPSEKLSFDIVIDCTGVVDADRTNMNDEVKKLKDIVFEYDGNIHRPNFVQIRWGKNFEFKGVLTTFDTSYTLFKPDGNPLRAKISLSFNKYISSITVKKKDADESPDVTHRVTVEDGVNLPQLCYNVWKDDSFYIQVARYNGLNKFRNLQGINRLIFPPIIQPS